MDSPIVPSFFRRTIGEPWLSTVIKGGRLLRTITKSALCNVTLKIAQDERVEGDL